MEIVGPGKLPQTALDVGRFVSEASGLVDKSGSGLISGEGRDKGSKRKNRKFEGERDPGQKPRP